MVLQTATVSASQTAYLGLRMTADEYFALGETRERYELVDGVVLMSPSATPRHQRLIGLIQHMIASFLDKNPVGEVFVELDVHLGTGHSGRDLVYRPDLFFLTMDKAHRLSDRATEPPDLIVEIVSPSSRRFDHETKKDDYERAGVAEYWIIDPEHAQCLFYRLSDTGFVAAPLGPHFYESQVLAGFKLDLNRVRAAFA